MDTSTPEHVHLVGSIGLDSVPEVFRTLGRTSGRRLRRVPDGEVGGRRLWVSWQYPLFRANAFLTATETARPRTGFLELRLADGVRGDDVVFGEFGYAREARASFIDFIRAQQRGDLPSDARFQVCLPTPFAVVNSFCYADRCARNRTGLRTGDGGRDRVAVRRNSARQALPSNGTSAWRWSSGMARIGAGARSVTTCRKLNSWRGCIASRRRCRTMSSSAFISATVISRPSTSSSRATPARWSSWPMHSRRPIAHPLAFIHMPVPVERNDDDFFKPFENMQLDRKTEVYLGLVHAKDGAEGTRKRIAVASKYVPRFRDRL